MTQSTSGHGAAHPLHVAIIMDGNGRWAAERNWPRVAGHRAGADSVRRVVEGARRLGSVKTLTLYAFSSDNWHRPPGEVAGLMRLFADHLGSETRRCVANGIRLGVIGRRDRLPAALLEAIGRAEAATAGCDAMHLRVAVDYSARDSILRAAKRMAAAGDETWEQFQARIGEVNHGGGAWPAIDLLIRSGGEQRLSDFLLWECAYAELYFTERMWPDFDVADLERAIAEYHRRERRFGRVKAATAPAGSGESAVPRDAA